MVRVGTRAFPWRYDVQDGTGYSSSTHPAGQWQRGALVRAAQPAFNLPDYNAMRDRSMNPNAQRVTKRKRFRRGR